MKKLLLILAATASMAITSCGGSSQEASNEANVDSLATAFENGIADAADSAAIVQLIGQAGENIKALEAKGDTAAVKAYKWKLQELIDKNKDKFEGMDVASAISEIANVENLAKQVVDAAKADAATAKADGIEAAANAAENSQKVQEVKDKVENAQQKVEDTKKAIDDVKSAAQNAKDAWNSLKKENK